METKQLRMGNFRYSPLIILPLVIWLFGGESLALADDDLPSCGYYSEPEFWFDIADFHDAGDEFEENFNNGISALGSVAVLDNTITIDLAVMNMTIVWHRGDAEPPLTDGQQVRVYAFGSGDGSDLAFYIFDTEYETLLIMGWNQFLYNLSLDGGTYTQNGEASMHLVCQYEDYEEFYGKNFVGNWGDSNFEVARPTEYATTDDARYQVYLPISYQDETDPDVAVVSYFQLMKAPPNVDDDDDSADDDSVDDDAADDDDDATPDADDDDDDDDGCGCN